MSAVRHVKSWFDPETTQAMGKAFDIAWSDVEDVFNSGFMMDWAREQIAKRIIEMAEGGERDPSGSAVMRFVLSLISRWAADLRCRRDWSKSTTDRKVHSLFILPSLEPANREFPVTS